MKQQTLAMASGFERYAKKTRRALFLEEMEQVVPWAQLCRLIEPHYPKAGNGRPPVGLERMLRVYFLQQWFNLSDPGLEEALYDSAVMRRFVGIDLGREPVPDETTVCKFRHLLEEHELGERLFERVGEHLQAKGLRLSTGTIVDATIINAPSSNKNAAGAGSGDAPDPQRSQGPRCHAQSEAARCIASLLARAQAQANELAVSRQPMAYRKLPGHHQGPVDCLSERRTTRWA